MGTAIARGGGGELSVNAARSSARGGGVFAGFGVSSSLDAYLGFAVFLVFRAVSFSLDFFCVVFGLGVGVWRRFDFDEPPGSGVSRVVADGVVPSGSPDSLADVVLRLFGDSCGPGDPLLFSLAPFFAVFLLKLGPGDFFGVGEASSSVRAFSDANLACGIAVDASSGVAEAGCFFAD